MCCHPFSGLQGGATRRGEAGPYARAMRRGPRTAGTLGRPLRLTGDAAAVAAAQAPRTGSGGEGLGKRRRLDKG